MQIVIDASTWTQTEKNYLQAAAVALLWQNGITYEKISARDGVIDISNPSSDASLVLTEPNLKTFIVTELEKLRIATEAARLEAVEKEAELLASEFGDIKLADVDAKIDAIQNLTQLKVLLKKFVRFVIART